MRALGRGGRGRRGGAPRRHRDRRRGRFAGAQRDEPGPRPVSPSARDARLLRGRAGRHGRRDLAGRRLVHRDPGAAGARARQSITRPATAAFSAARARSRPGIRRPYGHIRYAAFPAGTAAATEPKVPDGTADVVLTFRNVHNWIMPAEPFGEEAFRQMFAMLKPGGTLGVVEHRLPEERRSGAGEDVRLHQGLDGAADGRGGGLPARRHRARSTPIRPTPRTIRTASGRFRRAFAARRSAASASSPSARATG